MRYRDVVYFVLDSIKSLNGDSTITEEHVIFLANQYRLFLIEQKKQKEGENSLSSSNEQTICINLEQVDAIEGLEYCNDIYLRSVEEIPDVVDQESLKVSLADLFNVRTAFVSKERFRFVGHNKYLRNIIYITLGPDGHIYFNSSNPQFRYLKEAKITGIFEDAEAAAKLACDDNGEGNCDVMDSTFPLEVDLVPQMFELIIKQLLGVNYRPADTYNSSADELSDIQSFVRRNMKTAFQKQVEGQ